MPAAAQIQKVEIRPQAGKQEMFLSTRADIAIYGGAAGGGKSWALLLEPLRWRQVPGFYGVIFRRTVPQIRAAGSLWDQSVRLYSPIQAKPTESRLEWEFESTARIQFGQLEYESTVYEYQGSEICYLAFDELTHFTRGQFFYMLSRNRSTCGVRPYVRGTTNPDPDSWVAEFISWWIDPASGFPIPERAGALRYFAVVGDYIDWADDPQVLIDRYPDQFGPVTLASGTVIPGQPPKSVTFIPAKLTDNELFMVADPMYRLNLLALPPIEQARLLEGNWKIRAEAGKVFNRDWFKIVDTPPPGGIEVRYWDWAATEAKVLGTRTEPKKRDPDYTVGWKERKVGNFYYITDVVFGQWSPARADQIFVETTMRDLIYARLSGTQYRVRWEIEPGSAGIKENIRLIALLGSAVNRAGVRTTGDKMLRAKPFQNDALAGIVYMVRGAWNEPVLRHLHNQPDEPHDDIMDAGSGAHQELRGLVRRGGAAAKRQPPAPMTLRGVDGRSAASPSRPLTFR